jgi:hypothetical protein
MHVDVRCLSEEPWHNPAAARGAKYFTWVPFDHPVPPVVLSPRQPTLVGKVAIQHENLKARGE